MKNLWLVQTSGFNTGYLEQTIGALDRVGLEYKDFGVIGQEKIITNLNEVFSPDTRYISRGGVMLLEILNSVDSLRECASYIDADKDTVEYIEALKMSVDYDEDRFDQNVYGALGLPLVNASAEYRPCVEVLEARFPKDMFVKPSKDLKFFDGGVVKAGDTVGQYIKSGRYRPGFESETIVISPLVQIYTEYRFFVIEGEVITGSLYKRGNDIFPESYVPEYIMAKAREYAKIYSPSEIFVMDLADTENGVKIIEYNCWNCSGLYAVDAQKLFFEVDEYKKG